MGDNQVKIIQEIKKNPNISLSKLSIQLNISQTAIETNIKKLKEMSHINRIDPAKGGHWEVNEKL